MDKQLSLHFMVRDELMRMESIVRQMENELVKLPKGSIAKKNKKFYHIYRENSVKYMKAVKEEKQLEQLRTRREIKKALPVLRSRVEACKKFLEEDVLYDKLRMEAELPEQYHGANNSLLWPSGDIDPAQWKSEQYRQNSMPIINPSETLSGTLVRSKSEASIGSELERAGLFYRYEQELIINGEVFCPDFVLLLPKRRRLVIWEHFGMMDEPEYAKRAMHKLQEYSKAGYLLGFNLFFTYETKDMTFAVKGAKEMIGRIMALDDIKSW